MMVNCRKTNGQMIIVNIFYTIFIAYNKIDIKNIHLQCLFSVHLFYLCNRVIMPHTTMAHTHEIFIIIMYAQSTCEPITKTNGPKSNYLPIKHLIKTNKLTLQKKQNVVFL